MKCIEEHNERLDLLQKTLLVEERQKKRLLDLNIEKHNEIEEANQRKLYEGNTNLTTTSMMDQEDSHSQQLLDEMAKASSTINDPAVKVMTYVQGAHTQKKKKKKKKKE